MVREAIDNPTAPEQCRLAYYRTAKLGFRVVVGVLPGKYIRGKADRIVGKALHHCIGSSGPYTFRFIDSRRFFEFVGTTNLRGRCNGVKQTYHALTTCGKRTAPVAVAFDLGTAGIGTGQQNRKMKLEQNIHR